MGLTMGERLQDLRLSRGLTLKELEKDIEPYANKYGISLKKSTLANMESEKQTNYGYLNFLALADYFGVSTDYLLGRTENPSVEEDIQIACKVTGLSEKSIVILKSEAPKFEMQAMLTGETIEIPVGEWIINSIYPEMRLDLNRILFYLNFNLLLAKDSPISVSEYVYGAVSKISDKCKYKIDKYIQEQIGKMGYSDYKTITDMSREELFDFSKMEFDTSRQAFIISDKKKAGD